MRTIPWFNIDDGFYDHPKVDDLPLESVGLWTLAGAYCMRQLTDGVITDSRVRKFGGTPESIEPLLASSLWLRAEEGYRFKDWDHWQLTRAQIEEKREKDRLRKQKQRRDSDGTYAATPNGSPQPVPVGHREDSQPDSEGSHTVQSNPIQSNPLEGKPTRATRIPDDFTVTPEMETWAREKVPGLNIAWATEGFIDYWQSATKNAVKKDWTATWRGWMRRNFEDGKLGPRGQSPRPNFGKEEWMNYA